MSLSRIGLQPSSRSHVCWEQKTKPLQPMTRETEQGRPPGWRSAVGYQLSLTLTQTNGSPLVQLESLCVCDPMMRMRFLADEFWSLLIPQVDLPLAESQEGRRSCSFLVLHLLSRTSHLALAPCQGTRQWKCPGEVNLAGMRGREGSPVERWDLPSVEIFYYGAVEGSRRRRWCPLLKASC